MESDFEYKESALVCPERDRRAELETAIDNLCKDIIKTANELRAEPNERKIGRLEERFFTLRREIFDRQSRAWLDEEIYIDIACTVDGRPIRVNKVKKMLPWGKPAV